MIERHGGKILVLKKWDERKLAYELKKQKRGVYIIAYYTAPGASVSAIERDVNLSEDVIRVLVTSADHLKQSEMEAVEPQPIQQREERAPWDRPEGGRGGWDRPREDRGDRGDRAPRGAGGGRREDREETEEAGAQA
jgi:small subunit ribosomal protein S6